MFKPKGVSKKSYLGGQDDFRCGVKIDDNPWLNQPNKSVSTWWVTGWLHAQRGFNHFKKAKK